MRLLITSTLFIALFACNNSEKKAENTSTEKPKSINTSSYNSQMDSALYIYNQLQSNLVNWDSAQAALSAEKLAIAITKVNTDSLTIADSAKSSATQLKNTIEAEAKAVALEPTLTEKRRSFFTLSEAFYSLLKTTKYDNAVVYRMECPMAFNDEETANWLSLVDEVNNPYLGTKHPTYKSGMLHCGSTVDSINFSKK